MDDTPMTDRLRPSARLSAVLVALAVASSVALATAHQGGVPPAMSVSCETAEVRNALGEPTSRGPVGSAGKQPTLLIVSTLGSAPTNYQFTQVQEFQRTSSTPLRVVMLSAEDDQAALDRWHQGWDSRGMVSSVRHVTDAIWSAPLRIDRAPTSFLLRGDRCWRFNGAVQAAQLADALR